MKLSTAELERYCHTNLKQCVRPIRAVALEFQGLNRHDMLNQPVSPAELEYADAGVLFVIPYTAPWSWMNDAALIYTQELLDGMYSCIGLDPDTPLVSTGYSMGGLAALMFARYTSYKVSGCCVNSPVCDLPSHYHEREDLPRTLRNAFATFPGGVEAGLISRSPLHQVVHMPDIPYLMVAGALDTDVSKARHADRLAQAMREKGLSLSYYELSDMRHWQITDYRVWRAWVDFVKGFAV